MMQQAALVIEAEEERTDLAAVAIIAKAADHAVRRAPALDFEHGALAGAVGQVQALGDKKGINRYGEAVVPMDEALCRSVIDLSGRFYLVYEVPTRRQKIGNFSVELAEHFWRSFSETARFNLHIDCLRGRNTHHILEGTFKASARALRQAVERNSRITGIPSTKGSL